MFRLCRLIFRENCVFEFFVGHSNDGREWRFNSSKNELDKTQVPFLSIQQHYDYAEKTYASKNTKDGSRRSQESKKKTTSKQIGKLNTELRKCLQKKYIGLVANVSLLEDFDDETHQLQTS